MSDNAIQYICTAVGVIGVAMCAAWVISVAIKADRGFYDKSSPVETEDDVD